MITGRPVRAVEGTRTSSQRALLAFGRTSVPPLKRTRSASVKLRPRKRTMLPTLAEAPVELLDARAGHWLLHPRRLMTARTASLGPCKALPLVRAPPGLAVGLALKELRYVASMRRFAPRMLHAFGWV